MTRAKRRTPTDEQIAELLREGRSRTAIKRELGAGYARIDAVASTLDAAGEGFFDNDDEAIAQTTPAGADDADAPVTVAVDIAYFRALEALLGEVEENQRLRRVMEAA
jgi:hypothetical protein